MWPGYGRGEGRYTLGRRLEAEGLVWPLVVEDVAEGVELQLLLTQRGRRQLTALEFQGQVHAFVPAVLLRVAWVDAVGPNAQLDPPHGQIGKPARRKRGKRRAVVGADGQWQPKLAEG